MFDARLDDPEPVSSMAPAHFLHLAIGRISAAFAEAAAWIRQIIFRTSQPSLPAQKIVLGKISEPPRREANASRVNSPLAVENPQARDLQNAATKAALPDTRPAVPNPLSSAGSFTEAEKNRRAFDTYVKLSKANGERPGDALIPQNFETATVNHAHAVLDEFLAGKAQAESAGTRFSWPAERQEEVTIAIGVLEQQKDNPEARQKAALARKPAAVPAPRHTPEQKLTSFMAWRDWKNSPDRFPGDENFSIEAAREHAEDLISQYAGKPEAMQVPLKDYLNDAVVLTLQADEFEKRYRDQRMAAITLEARPIRDRLLANAQQPDAGVGAGAPPPPPPPQVSASRSLATDMAKGSPPPPPPRVRTGAPADGDRQPSATLPAAPRKQQLAQLIGALPNWSGRQLADIASAAFPMNSEQVSRAIQGLRSIDWTLPLAPHASRAEAVMDETQRRLNYSRQREADNERLVENLEYAKRLLETLQVNQLGKGGAPFAPLVAVHALRDQLSPRIGAELQRLLPPKTATAKQQS